MNNKRSNIKRFTLTWVVMMTVAVIGGGTSCMSRSAKVMAYVEADNAVVISPSLTPDTSKFVAEMSDEQVVGESVDDAVAKAKADGFFVTRTETSRKGLFPIVYNETKRVYGHPIRFRQMEDNLSRELLDADKQIQYKLKVLAMLKNYLNPTLSMNSISADRRVSGVAEEKDAHEDCTISSILRNTFFPNK